MLPTPKTNTEKVLVALYHKLNGDNYTLPTLNTNVEKILGAIVNSDFNTNTGGGGDPSNPFDSARWFEFKSLLNYSSYTTTGLDQATLDIFMEQRIEDGFNHFYVFNLPGYSLYFFCVRGSKIINTNGTISFTGTGVSYEKDFTTVSGRGRTSPVNWSNFSPQILNEFHS